MVPTQGWPAAPGSLRRARARPSGCTGPGCRPRDLAPGGPHDARASDPSSLPVRGAIRPVPRVTGHMDLLHNGLGSLDPRTPVVVGVGTASGHAEATDLMTRALVAAGSDAGSPRLLERIDWIAVPQGSWSYPDPGRLAAGGVGAAGARTHLYELGIPQQRLINDALVAITTGASEVGAVVGGEAKRWARDEARSGIEATETDQPGAIPDVTHRREGALLEPVEVANRLWDPVQQYAMIDNALRAADGRTLAEHRAEVADLWSRFNGVAGTNPEAAFPT